MSEFKPTDHSAKEVLEYLATAEAPEIERVQAAEAAREDGKDPRKTILAFAATPAPAPQEQEEPAQAPDGDPVAPSADAEAPAPENAQEDVMKAPPLAEAVKGTPDLEGEAYVRGYQGHSPADAAGETEDLSLPAVLRRMAKGK